MLEVILQNIDGSIYDVSELVTDAAVKDNYNKSSVLNIKLINDSKVNIKEGTLIRLKNDRECYFFGNVFKLEYSESTEYSVTAYDSLRYLQNKDTYVFEGQTASEALKKICSDFKLKSGKIEDTAYRVPRTIFDDKSLLDIISDLLKVTLRNTGQLFILKNIDGAVTLRNIKSNLTNFVVDPESNILGYSFDTSIDEDTYNQIKLVRDNKDTGKREVYMAKDSSTIKMWGLLQYYEKVDDSLNNAQIIDKVNALLMLKNRVVRNFTNVKVIGDNRLRAGNMIFINLPERNIKGFLLCTKADHSFGNASHTVTADFKLID